MAPTDVAAQNSTETVQVAAPLQTRRTGRRIVRRAISSDDEPDYEQDKLSFADSSEASTVNLSSMSHVSTSTPELDLVLELCLSRQVLDFTDFVNQPPAPFEPSQTIKWRKIGEASYSEVFETQNTVVKIIPVSSSLSDVVSPQVESTFLSDLDLVRREIQVSSLVGTQGSAEKGFVAFRG